MNSNKVSNYIGELVTFTATVSASGNSIPPFLYFQECTSVETKYLVKL